MKQVEEFENYKIQEGSLQFDNNTAISFGCIGTVDASSNTEEVVKKCEGVVVKKKKRITDMTVAITGHAKIPASRKIIGLSNEGLKTGIYAYGTDTFSAPFTFAAKIIDMDGNVKYIAFPKIENTKGLSVKVDNGVTEIAMDDFEFSAMIDSNNKFYYEAYESELEDETVKSKWLTNFTPELVKQTEG
mgnify:FL=1|jgi:hypothetical protein|nr:MAG TPA: major tail protein [Caudoviricetes sp.]